MFSRREKRKLRPEKRKLRRGFGSKAKFGRKSAEIRTFCGGLGPLRPKSTTLPEHNVGIATPSPGPLQNGPLSTTSHLEKNESFTKVRTHVPRKAKRKLGTFKTKVCLMVIKVTTPVRPALLPAPEAPATLGGGQ